MNSPDGGRCALNGRPALLALLLALGCVCAATWGQPVRPPASGAYEDEPIRKTTRLQADTSGQASPQPRGSSALLDTRRVAAALAIVLGLIFALKWMSRRFFPGVAGGKTTGLVKILGRTPVSPKQQVLLIAVGRRVLVVADNGGQLTALSQITDADEVAALIGQASGSSAHEPQQFETELDKAEKDFAVQSTAAAQPSEPDRNLSWAQGELDGLMKKVRTLARQLGRS